MPLLKYNFSVIHLLLLSGFHFLTTILLSEYFPVIWPDEVLFYNPAQELATTGQMKTSVLSGLIPGMESYTFWMPPVFIVSLASILKLFGDSIIIARFFSSSIAFASALLLYRLAVVIGINKNRPLLLFLVFSDFLFIIVSHSSRMESMTMFWGVLALLAVYDIKTRARAVLPGIFSAMSFLSHPFGAVYGLLVFMALLGKKTNRVQNLLVYISGGLIPLIFWFLYIYPEFDLFLLQFGAQLSRKRDLLKTFGFMDRVQIIISGYRFNYLKLAQLAIAGIMIALNYSLIKTSKTFQMILIWLLAMTSAVFLSTESWYVIHTVPPLVFAMVYLYSAGRKYSSAGVYATLLLNVFTTIWLFYANWYMMNTKNLTEQYYAEIAAQIGNRNKIYLQAIPDPYFYLKKHYPQKELREFIPGELSIPEKYFMPEIERQEAFIFYNSAHGNRHVMEYLEKNKSLFIRKTVEVPTGHARDLRLKAELFLKKP